MNLKPPTVEEVEAEIKELDEKIGGLNRLVERKSLLVNYKVLLERICSNGTGSSDGEKATAGSSHLEASVTDTMVMTDKVEAVSNSPVVDFAYKVLSSSAKSMKVPDIVKAMLALGWNGSGDEEKDKTTVYNAMYNNSKLRFTRVRRGLWTTKK